MEKHLKLQSEIKREWVAIQKAQADGSPPEVLLPMRTDIGKKLELYKRLTAILSAQKRLSEPTDTTPGPSSQPPPPVAVTPTPTTTSTADPGPSEPGPLAPEPAQPPLSSTTAAEQSVQSSTIPPKDSYPSEVTTQIHHPIQQQTPQSVTQPGIFPYVSLVSLSHLLAGGATQLPTENNPGAVLRPGPRGRQWHGMFSSVTANGAQETIIYVSVDFQPNAEP